MHTRKLKLMEQMKAAMRTKRYSLKMRKNPLYNDLYPCDEEAGHQCKSPLDNK